MFLAPYNPLVKLLHHSGDPSYITPLKLRSEIYGWLMYIFNSDYVTNANIPQVAISIDSPQQSMTLSNDTLNMYVPNSNHYRIEYSIYTNDSSTPIKETYSGIAYGNKLVLNTSEVSMDISIISTTNVTITWTKLNYYKLVITKIYILPTPEDFISARYYYCTPTKVHNKYSIILCPKSRR